ncbi:DUF6942 family protein [Shewanella waksmanii]|uniref:DUF6942 family protein n=1 Tax=Shewanella waksmanii TaxID=213783 RepID=UPI0037366FEC
MILGPTSATTIFYLPTAPTLCASWHYRNDDAIDKIVADNGNHWRKILVIMAKLMSPDDDWRQYMASELLKRHEAIVIDAQALSANAHRHIVCGQKMWQQLQLANDNPAKVAESRIIQLPYLDYRQCPNTLIQATREQYLLADINRKSSE